METSPVDSFPSALQKMVFRTRSQEPKSADTWVTRLLQGSKLLHAFFGCLVGFFSTYGGMWFWRSLFFEVLKDEVVTATYFNGKSCGNLLGDYNLKIFS